MHFVRTYLGILSIFLLIRKQENDSVSCRFYDQLHEVMWQVKFKFEFEFNPIQLCDLDVVNFTEKKKKKRKKWVILFWFVRDLTRFCPLLNRIFNSTNCQHAAFGTITDYGTIISTNTLKEFMEHGDKPLFLYKK